MYQITIQSLSFSQNQEKRDIYCKIIEGEQQQQTKVIMDTIKNAQWDQQLLLSKTSEEVIFQVIQWKGENQDITVNETKILWEQLLKQLDEVQQYNFDNWQISLKIQEYIQQAKDEEIKQFKKYLNDTGIEQSFKLIFAEILSKKIDRTEVYTYTALRLRQIGEDLKMFLNNNHKMSQLLNNISEVQQDDEPDQFLESQDQ